MNKLRSKAMKRCFAFVLSIAMLMSNMTVLASEATPGTNVSYEVATEGIEFVNETGEEGGEGGGEIPAATEPPAATETPSATPSESPSATPTATPTATPSTKPVPTLPADGNKIDVWDFGAEDFNKTYGYKSGKEVYNVKLTATVINSWYSGVDGGTGGKNLASAP